MKRKRHLVDDSSYPVFITTTITEWMPVFEIRTIAVESLAILESVRAGLKARIMGYVLMPHHFHAIILTHQKGDLSVLMRKWKSLTARLIVDNLNRMDSQWLTVFQGNAQNFNRPEKYQVWQPRFDDFAIRTPEQFKVKLNYIHENPVRSGLVLAYEEYPYSSVHDYMGKSNSFVEVECVMAM